MKELDVCFIGIGSIAKRHIINLVQICEEDNIKLSIDAIRRNGKKEDNDIVFSYINNVYSSVNELNHIYDAIFITNPTELHYKTLENVLNNSKSFFIEKPICTPNQINYFSELKYNSKKNFYIAGPLKYNVVIDYLKNNLNLNNVYSIRAISSSYLPEWRPNIDYRDTYSAHKDMGGGVSIDLIHEWDYLTYIFGNPQRIKMFNGKKSNLEIDSDDYAIYIAEYRDKILELHLDYFGRKTIRRIELLTKDDTIIADLINNTIDFLVSNKRIKFDEERNKFQKRELRQFISIIDNKDNIVNDIEHALEVLKLTQGNI